MTSHTIAVAGASGTIGTDLVPTLVASGARVRALTRRPTNQFTGADAVFADFADTESVHAALEGVNTVFLNSPSSQDAAAQQIQVIDTALKRGVQRIVLLSQYGADAASPVRFLRWHAEVERHLGDSGIAGSVLRPNLFLQSLLAFADPISNGLLAAPAGSAAVSAVDTRDLAAAAAAAILSSEHDGAVYTLTGPRAVSHSEIAQALSDATATPISYHDISASDFSAALQPFMPRWQVEGLVEDYAHYARGEAAAVTSDVTTLTGRPARDLIEFARDHARLFTRP